MKFIKTKPTLGDTRWVKRFAWLPKQMGVIGGVVWLERYMSFQKYDMWRVPGPGYKGTRTVFGWREIDAWFCRKSLQNKRVIND